MPTPDEQIHILDAMHKLAMTTDLEGFQGIFLKLLVHHEFDAVGNLLEAVKSYNAARDIISSIANYSQQLDIIPPSIDL